MSKNKKYKLIVWDYAQSPGLDPFLIEAIRFEPTFYDKNIKSNSDNCSAIAKAIAELFYFLIYGGFEDEKLTS